MKKSLFLLIIIFTAVTVSMAATMPSKSYHKDVTTCIDCHGEENPIKLKSVSCKSCHGENETMAKQTESLGVQNPHNSIHWGTALPCEECHKEHSAPKNYCTDSCHYWPNLKTK